MNRICAVDFFEAIVTGLVMIPMITDEWGYFKFAPALIFLILSADVLKTKYFCHKEFDIDDKESETDSVRGSVTEDGYLADDSLFSDADSASDKERIYYRSIKMIEHDHREIDSYLRVVDWVRSVEMAMIEHEPTPPELNQDQNKVSDINDANDNRIEKKEALAPTTYREWMAWVNNTPVDSILDLESSEQISSESFISDFDTDFENEPVKEEEKSEINESVYDDGLKLIDTNQELFDEFVADGFLSEESSEEPTNLISAEAIGVSCGNESSDVVEECSSEIQNNEDGSTLIKPRKTHRLSNISGHFCRRVRNSIRRVGVGFFRRCMCCGGCK